MDDVPAVRARERQVTTTVTIAISCAHSGPIEVLLGEIEAAINHADVSSCFAATGYRRAGHRYWVRKDSGDG